MSGSSMHEKLANILCWKLSPRGDRCGERQVGDGARFKIAARGTRPPGDGESPLTVIMPLGRLWL
jgi:hypothetical protein